MNALAMLELLASELDDARKLVKNRIAMGRLTTSGRMGLTTHTKPYLKIFALLLEPGSSYLDRSTCALFFFSSILSS